MEQGFRVHPGALTSYEQVIQDQTDQLAQIWPRLESVPLSSEDFGKLPDAHNLYEAYQEHVQAERENFADLLELLHDTCEGLRTTAANYESQDAHIEASFGGGQ
ncbi:hypothetical protein ACIHAA_01840 [Streptomyces sp. NPDC052040]|uniref:hypothetical protein n=1 Tax=unclassified Streptomyces TaxID=2593676 RepID=UPI0037D4E447